MLFAECSMILCGSKQDWRLRFDGSSSSRSNLENVRLRRSRGGNRSFTTSSFSWQVEGHTNIIDWFFDNTNMTQRLSNIDIVCIEGSSLIHRLDRYYNVLLDSSSPSSLQVFWLVLTAVQAQDVQGPVLHTGKCHSTSPCTYETS